MFEVAAIAARVMLASEGYDLAKVLRTLDFWMETAANGVPSAEGPPAVERGVSAAQPGHGRGGPGRVSRSSVPTPRGTSTRRSASWPAGPPVRTAWGLLPRWPARPPIILTREAAGDRDGALRAADAALEVYQGMR